MTRSSESRVRVGSASIGRLMLRVEEPSLVVAFTPPGRGRLIGWTDGSSGSSNASGSSTSVAGTDLLLLASAAFRRAIRSSFLVVMTCAVSWSCGGCGGCRTAWYHLTAVASTHPFDERSVTIYYLEDYVQGGAAWH